METDHAHARYRSKALHILFRMYNHQVHVHRFFRPLGYSFHHRETKGDIGHKSAVHHVQVEEIGVPVHYKNVLFQMQEIGRQDGGCYLYHYLKLRTI